MSEHPLDTALLAALERVYWAAQEAVDMWDGWDPLPAEVAQLRDAVRWARAAAKAYDRR